MNQQAAPGGAKKSGGGKVMLIVLVAVCLLSVPCIGVLAAIGIPSFIGYLNRSKTAEASSNLRNLYTGAAAYYSSEQWGSANVIGGPANATTNCAVHAGRTSNVPSASKTMLPSPLGEPFDSLGFSLADPVYYQYEIVSAGGCNHAPGTPVYTFRAYGDLDGDGTTSLFEIAASAGQDGELVRSPGVYTENELE